MENSITIKLAADIASLQTSMDSAARSVQNHTQKMESYAKGAAVAIGGYLTIDAIKNSIKETIDFADSLSKLSQKAGMSADSLYALSAAAKLSDVDFKGLETSLVKFNKNLGEMQTGGGKDAQNALKYLGISAKDAHGEFKTTDSLLVELSDKFKDLPDGIQKTTIATQLFGKAGADMIPLLNSGSEALREYSGVMTSETAKAAERLNDSFTRLHLSTQIGIIKTFQSALPAVDSLSFALENTAKKGSLLTAFGEDIGSILKGVTKSVAGGVFAFEWLTTSIGGAASAVKSLASGDLSGYHKSIDESKKKIGEYRKEYAEFLGGLDAPRPNRNLSDGAKATASKTLGDYDKQAKDGLKAYNNTIAEQIAAIARKNGILEETQKLELDSLGLSKIDLDYQKEVLKINFDIASKQQEISLLKSKKYDADNVADKAKDLEKIKQLEAEIGLKQKEAGAAEEKRGFALSEINKQVANSLSAITNNEYETAFAGLVTQAENFTKAGADAGAVAELFVKSLEKLDNNTAFSNYKTTLDLQKEIIGLSLYGKEKEMALEDIRHREVLANLQNELENHKILQSEYEARIAIENERFRQNTDAFRQYINISFETLQDSISDVLQKGIKGEFEDFGEWLKSFWGSLSGSLAKTLSDDLAGSLVSEIRGFASGGFSAGSLASALGGSAPSFGSFADFTDWANKNGSSVDTAILAQATELAQGGNLSGASNLLGTLSNVQSIATLPSKFQNLVSFVSDPSGYFMNLGAGGGFLGNTATGFGAWMGGYTAPAANSAMGLGYYGGGALAGGLGGYALGALGDKLFGKQTQAGNYGAIGGTLGAVVGGPIGAAIGAGIGSVVGGMFGGGKKYTGGGSQLILADQNYWDWQQNGSSVSGDFGSSISANSLKGWAMEWKDWKKSGGWFSSGSSGTEVSIAELAKEQNDALKQIFKNFNNLGNTLGLGGNDLHVQSGVYSSAAALENAAAKTYLANLMGLNMALPETSWVISDLKGRRDLSAQQIQEQVDAVTAALVADGANEKRANRDKVYSAWEAYASENKKTVSEAILSVLGEAAIYRQSFDIFKADYLGQDTLQLKAAQTQQAFELIASNMGVANVSVQNYNDLFAQALQSSPTPETVQNWEALGNALQQAAAAEKAYRDALEAQRTTLNEAYLSLTGGESALTQQAAATLGISLTKDAFLGFLQTAESGTTILSKKQQAAVGQLTGYWQAQIQATKAALEQLAKSVASLKKLADDLAIDKTLSPYLPDTQAKLAKELFQNSVIDFQIAANSGNAELMSGAQANVEQYSKAYLEALRNASTDAASYLQAFGQVTNQLRNMDYTAGQYAGIAPVSSATTSNATSTTSANNVVAQTTETMATLLSSMKNDISRIYNLLDDVIDNNRVKVS
jgi:hypothetical protein